MRFVAGSAIGDRTRKQFIPFGLRLIRAPGAAVATKKHGLFGNEGEVILGQPVEEFHVCLFYAAWVTKHDGRYHAIHIVYDNMRLASFGLDRRLGMTCRQRSRRQAEGRIEPGPPFLVLAQS